MLADKPLGSPFGRPLELFSALLRCGMPYKKAWGSLKVSCDSNDFARVFTIIHFLSYSSFSISRLYSSLLSMMASCLFRNLNQYSSDLSVGLTGNSRSFSTTLQT
jgi:hypothetical protein